MSVPEDSNPLQCLCIYLTLFFVCISSVIRAVEADWGKCPEERLTGGCVGGRGCRKAVQ